MLKTLSTKFFSPLDNHVQFSLVLKEYYFLVQAKVLTSYNVSMVFTKYITTGLNPVLLCNDFETGTFILVAPGIQIPIQLTVPVEVIFSVCK